MIVLVDTREQLPWVFDEMGIVCKKQKLATGDYSLPGLEDQVCIERKSLDDWIGTVMKHTGRFYRELDRMRSFQFSCVIIESGVRRIDKKDYRSMASPASVLGFIAEISVVQAVPVYLGGTRAESQILAGHFLKMANKKFHPASHM